MNIKAEQQTSALDIIKLLLSISIIVGAIWAFYAFSEQSQLLRMLGMLAAIGLAVAVAMTSTQGRSIWKFASDARVETRKVIWPTRTELVQTTLVVIVMVLLIALFLWAIDSILFWVVQLVTGQEG